MDLINEKRTMTTVRLTENQKRVMTTIVSSATEKLAAENISTGRGMITARDILVKLELIVADDTSAALTSAGEQLLKDYNLIDEMGELTEEGSKFAYGDQEEVATESVFKQINILAEEGRIIVSYDVHWQKDKMTKKLRDEGQTDEEAIRAVHKLFGGRNHTVKRK